MKLLEELSSFDPTVVRRVRHGFAQHPLMTAERLGEFAMRQQPQYVRFHDGRREIGTVFGDVLASDPGRRSLRRAIDNLGAKNAGVFVQINCLRMDPEYGALIDAFLDEVDSALPPRERGLLYRDASAFLASPGSVTPYHLDHEQNFLLHMGGPKTLYVWDGRDRSIVPYDQLEAFYANGSQVPFRPELADRGEAFHLQPGDGVYMPAGSPHAVQTGAGVTVTFSMLFYTHASMRTIEAFKANDTFRGLGLSPSPIGAKPAQDEVKRHTYRALRVAKAAMRGRRPAPLRYI
jgi:Cupin superfamily protein